jgi:hypothetical protein
LLYYQVPCHTPSQGEGGGKRYQKRFGPPRSAATPPTTINLPCPPVVGLRRERGKVLSVSEEKPSLRRREEGFSRVRGDMIEHGERQESGGKGVIQAVFKNSVTEQEVRLRQKADAVYIRRHRGKAVTRAKACVGAEQHVVCALWCGWRTPLIMMMIY